MAIAMSADKKKTSKNPTDSNAPNSASSAIGLPKKIETSSTISNSSREQKYRHSFQVESSTKNEPKTNLRLTQSQIFSKKPRILLSNPSPTIPEVEQGEEDTLEVVNEKERKLSSYQGSRKTSKVSVNSKTSLDSKNEFGYENGGFVGSNGNLSRNGGSFIRGVNVGNSVRSSAHDPSVGSLEVQREQYCCCARWSRCERRLAISVLILAVIIVVLVVVVGVLAGDNSIDQKFIWRL